ncbi:hypothetical protein [Spirosoma foliorum]|uniref:Uncharacterized protein n=1 Tax=Spirosoma foliorum TaxID=2710596 RepID=A0A7G5H6L4_9BACT|nr:hypothetical protein [Spirosoma foliorum]QMW06756.1 hypothetical protein H3H32_18620 [Spirosoma foliorum]
MKTRVITLLLLSIFTIATTTNAQNLPTADEVLNAYFKALGGKRLS